MANDNTSKQKEIRNRRRFIQRLYLRKLSIEEIAEKVGVDEKTVDRDLAVIREECNKLLRSSLEFREKIQDVVQEYLLATDEVIREFWINYHSKETPVRIKVNILKNVMDTYNNKLESMQKLGLVPTQPIKIEEVVKTTIEAAQPHIDKSSLNYEFTEFIKKKYQYPKDRKNNQQATA